MSDLKSLSNLQLLEIISCQEKQIEILENEKRVLKEQAQRSSFNEDEAFSLRQIITLMPGNVFWKNREGVFLGCNKNHSDFFGLSSPDDIIGKTNLDLMPAEFGEPLDHTDKEIMKTGVDRYVEEAGLSIGNEETIFYSQKIPLRNKQNEVIGLLGIAMNITARKRIEKNLEIAKQKAEASDKAKSEFLATVNHELRTPLAGILGLIEILKEENFPNEELRKNISDLENCAEYLLSLVNNVLDFSQLEAEKKTLKYSPVFLPDLITEIKSMVTGLVERKELAIQLHIGNNIPAFVLTDVLALNQILINLVNNAIKFTSRGYITLTLNCLQQTKTHADIEIIIRDTGKGIPLDQHHLIFDPFYQLDDIYIRSMSRNGTGLGLAIVKKLADLLKIKIRIESKMEEGTSFYLTGRYKIYKPSSKSPPYSYRLQNNHSLPEMRKKILLVEDDRVVLEVHTKILKKSGFQVDQAMNGYTALKILNTHDLALVDLGLPDINGFELIRLIREENKNLAIIALTGYTGEKERSACLSAGANGMINKPISATNLRKLIREYL